MPTLDDNQGHTGKDDREDDFGYSSSSSDGKDEDEDEFEKARGGRRGRARVEGNKTDPSQVPLLLNPSPSHPASPSPLSSETGDEQRFGRKSDWVGMEDLENGAVGASGGGGAKRAEEGNQVKRISPWIISEWGLVGFLLPCEGVRFERAGSGG